MQLAPAAHLADIARVKARRSVYEYIGLARLALLQHTNGTIFNGARRVRNSKEVAGEGHLDSAIRDALDRCFQQLRNLVLQPGLLHRIEARDQQIRRRCALRRDGELPQQCRLLPSRKPTLHQLLDAVDVLPQETEELFHQCVRPVRCPPCRARGFEGAVVTPYCALSCAHRRSKPLYLASEEE